MQRTHGAPTTTRCAGSDLLVTSVNPVLPDLATRVRHLQMVTGMVFCPECDDLTDTRISYCEVRLVEHQRPLCPWTDEWECAMAAERAVAGTAAEPEPCPVHAR